MLTIAGIWPSSQLQFDVGITTLFPPNDPVLRAYQDGLKQFGGVEVVVAAYTDPELLTVDGLMRLHQFSETFRDLKPLGVEGVASLADVRWPLAPLDPTPLFAQIGKLGRSRGEIRTDLLKSQLYRNVLLGDDGETTAISLTIRPERTGLERKRLIAGIRERAERNRFKTVVAGGPMLIHDAAAFVDQDGRTLGWVSTLALAAVIGILFRKIRWVVLPLAVVHVTLVWTKALLWLVETRLSMVSTTLTALVTVIGVAGVVQVTARYREERERADAADALLRTMAAAGPAVFWAGLTTAAGFGSLFISSIAPVRSFAIMLSLASALVFFVTAALVPSVVLFGKRPCDPGAAPGERNIERLPRGDHGLEPRAAAAGGCRGGRPARARRRRNLPHPYGNRFHPQLPAVERGGRRLQLRRGAIGRRGNDGTGILRAGRLHSGAGEPLAQPRNPSPQDAEPHQSLGPRRRGRFLRGRRHRRAQPMDGPQGQPRLQALALDQQRPDLVPPFWNKKGKQMRVMLRAREQASSAAKNDLIAAVERIGREVLDQPNSPAHVRVTGVYPLLNHLVSGLMSDQLNTLLFATAAVFSVMCIALRSIRLAIVGLVPKIGPILMLLGAMGWLGVPIDMGTPIIASVSIGISVGFSIHYLYRFHQERLAGVPFDQALRATHRRVGSAMVFSNLALVVGFAALAASNFIPTVHFSVLADVALIGGLAGNLLVLPLLLKLIPP